MHYYQHHIGDFIKATARLSDSQSMAYLRLLWMYYDSEKPLKPDSKVLAFQIGATVEETELLLESYFWLAESGWHHSRCDQEIQEYHSFLEKKSNAGKASAERRKNNRSTGVEQVLNSGSTDEQLTTNHKPITNNNIKTQRGSRLPTDFVMPDSWGEWCEKERPDLIPKKIFDSFKDFWISKPGAGGVKLNWEATWRNWVRSQKQGYVAPQDIVRVTTPTPANHDAALRKIEADRKKAVPIPANIREQMKSILGEKQ